MYDLVIRNGRVVDPATRTEGRYTIGVRGGRIVSLTLDDVQGDRVIDARGLVVSPGFIDVHTHIDGSDRGALNQACIGVTTAVGGNCGSIVNRDAFGGSVADRMEDIQAVWQSQEAFPDLLDRVERGGYPINLAMQVGNGYLRQLVGAKDKMVPASAGDIGGMVRLAEDAMDAGAYGVSFGLAYCPGTSREELLALSAVAARHGGLISSHPRGNGPGFPGALPSGIQSHQELIDVGRDTGVRVLLSHIAHQLAFPSRPYAAIVERGLEQIEAARRQGIDVTADTMPVSVFGAIVSQPFLAVALSPAIEKVFHSTLEDALEIMDGPHKGEKMTPELFMRLRAEAPNTQLQGHLMREDSMIRTLLPDCVMVSNDSAVEISPMEPLVLGKMVRQKKVLSLMEALAKMTILPAECFGLHTKGRIAVGADADLVIFDPLTIDADDVDHLDLPKIPGIEHVIVNGVPVVDRGVVQMDARPGKILRHRDWA